jgi:hypothetical protein
MPIHEKVAINKMAWPKGTKKKTRKKAYAHKWPRIAIARSHQPIKVRKKREEKNRKKKKVQPIVKKVKKDIISWKWFPSSSSILDEMALNDFIENADASDWSTLNALPNQASKRLRIVQTK